MYKLPAFYLIFLFTLTAFSQNSDFESVVLEKTTSRPVQDASVSIEASNISTKTNSEGLFFFKNEIPYGEHLITVSKEGYETLYFYLTAEENKQIILEKVEIEITKDEAKRRKNVVKENAKRLKEAKKANKAKDKLLAKQAKKLKRRNTVDIVYNDTSIPEQTEAVTIENNAPKPIVVTETQLKYAKILNVPVETLTNKELYNFIDEWMGTPYLWGGSTKNGIDCSSFTQRLNLEAFKHYIERTAFTQFDSEDTDKFTGKESLKEGDLLFFRGLGPDKSEKITHVGVYLHNNKFVHATSSKRTEGVSGVKISDLSDKYWSHKFVAGGRRITK